MRLTCRLCGFALLAVLQPALAASFNCDRADDVVEKTICADQGLSVLDSKLSAAYKTALARDSTQASSIKRDQSDWLGERDDTAWAMLSQAGEAVNAVPTLARLYKQRIVFLRNLDDPLDVRGSPVARTLLSASQALPPGTSDVLATLWQQGLVVLPLMHRAWSRDGVTDLLPAPPDSGLRESLDRIFYGSPVMHGSQVLQYGDIGVAYLPSVGLGGIYEIGGTADCRTWTFFEVVGTRTHKIEGSPQSLRVGCGAQVQSYPALMNGLPVVVAQITADDIGYWEGGIAPQTTDLQWQRWLGDRWGAEVDVRVRFERVVRVKSGTCSPSLDCKAVRAIALTYARDFDQRPLPITVQQAATLSTGERAEFRKMLAAADSARGRYASLSASTQKSLSASLERHTGVTAGQVTKANHALDRVWVAEQRSETGSIPCFGQPQCWLNDDSFDDSAVYFPARIEGQLVLGEIGHGWTGATPFNGHTVGSEWLVGFWRWQNDKLIPLAGFVVGRDSGRPLLAARMWPLPR